MNNKQLIDNLKYRLYTTQTIYSFCNPENMPLRDFSMLLSELGWQTCHISGDATLYHINPKYLMTHPISAPGTPQDVNAV